ncbi:DUF1963 domain-containing protein [Paludibaculum fermentans]|uniref:DUF1963 domain-containing protein n=1 Tax=Paludibaculum fermentans TaxID=1473598 RepID=A0A7S7NS03_PALFE|nr:DUF1963 domain-containing protein [Paludibaculum fermentans]QOY88771.1 DUF1963 domain-containing protein [Paludibaculum fermentans]
MSDSIDQLHADYKSNTSRDRDQQLVARLRSTPGLAAELIQRLLLDLPNLPGILPAALLGLQLDQFDPLARTAASTLRQDPCHAAAQDFIAHASLQALPPLRPHLQELFYVQPNWTTYYSMWPWRQTGVTEFEFLKRHLGTGMTFWDGGSSRTTQRAALEALFETREPEVLEFLEDRLPREDFHLHARDIGMEKSAEGYRKLHSEQTFHLSFPSSYIDGSALAARWLPMAGLEYHGLCLPQDHIFGGEGTGECRRCHQRLVNLLTLTPVPPGLGVTGLDQLSLQVCFSCLDLGVLFYEHDNHGSTRESALTVREGVGRVENCGSLRQTPVGLIRTPERWKWQDWALSNSRENLNRLGGHPAWIQNAEYPACPQCRQTMIHLLQLDSDLPMENGSEWWWGSGGCGYVSWCDQCKISAVQCQFT